MKGTSPSRAAALAATGNVSAKMGSTKSHQLTRKGKSMTIVTVGIDLAKNVFAVHGINEAGKPELVRPSGRAPSSMNWSPCYRRASSVWKPAPARTTGRVCSNSTATLSS